MMAKSKLGMICFLASEVGFFATLILAYIYYRGASAGGPNAANTLEPRTAAIFTALLLASSVTIWRAEKSAEQRRPRRLQLWLLATVALGATFLVGQGREYLLLLSQNVTIGRDLFGTTFFTLTGVHGLLVLSGLIALLVLFGLALAGDFNSPPSPGLEAISWYWHFVDAVWIVIFSIVYVWPLL
jgi:heme/copper-type cytochrome/quinol oxidase subunit 3